MQMQDKSIVMNVTEKILGVSCVVIMLFLVRNDLKWFSIYSLKEFIFFKFGCTGNYRIFYRLVFFTIEVIRACRLSCVL